MPKGPKGEKRPADAVGAAVKSMRILTGEQGEDGSDVVRSAAGRKGGDARAAKLSDKQRSAAASKAAKSRWKRD